jgi:hypothetical protein
VRDFLILFVANVICAVPSVALDRDILKPVMEEKQTLSTDNAIRALVIKLLKVDPGPHHGAIMNENQKRIKIYSRRPRP